MHYTTSLGQDDWVAGLHACTDPVGVAGEVLVGALRTLHVDAACVHRHHRGRTTGWRLGARRDGLPDPGCAGGDLLLRPGEVRGAHSGAQRPDVPAAYAGWLVVDLASAWNGGTHVELYSADPSWPDEGALLRARAFGSAAGLALRRVEQAMHLQRALVSRTVIGQAQGVLMERFGLAPPTAVAFLRRLSQDGNRPLRDVAQELVDDLASGTRAATVGDRRSATSWTP